MKKGVEVRPISRAREYRAFLKLPWKIYRGDPNWVPPLLMDQKNLLNPQKNPFFKHGEIEHILAWRNSKAVGRISAVIDHNYNRFHEERTGFFGFFESINDEAVAHKLFQAAEAWLREHGMNRMLGPANPSTNDTLSFLVDAFDKPPVLHMAYNPPYYPKLCEDYGFRKAMDLYAYYMEDITPISDKIKRVASLIRKKMNITVRSVQMNRLHEEIKLIKIIYNDAWEKNWGFVPWTDEELEHLAKELKPIGIPELVLFAFVDGEPAGFSLSLPDYNVALKRINGRLFPFGLIKLLWYSRRIDMLRVWVMGVRKKFQNMGIDAVFYYETYTRGTKLGFRQGEFSWILENNLPVRNALENWGARIYKTYRLYQKEI